MAPNLGQEALHTAHRTTRGEKPPHTSPANSTQLGPQGCHTLSRRDGDRARQTQLKRDSRGRRNKMVVPRSASPTVPWRRCNHLTDRMTYTHNGGARVRINNHYEANSLPRPQQGRDIQEGVAHDDGYSEDGGAVQTDSPRGGQQDEAEYVKNDTGYETGMAIDDFVDLFGPEPSPPLPHQQSVSTRPVQYGSAHHMPFNLNLHPPRPVQPATRREPIRIINTFASDKPDVDSMTSASAVDSPVTSTAKVTGMKKHPVNPYRGNDPIKKRVQNKKLQLILSGRPLPKPRKNVDRMVLKCTGKQEFR